jgi:hypothetical protein
VPGMRSKSSKGHYFLTDNDRVLRAEQMSDAECGIALGFLRAYQHEVGSRTHATFFPRLTHGSKMPGVDLNQRSR